MKFIVFSDADSGETLVCTEQTEAQCVAEWFELGCGRDLDEYERQEFEGSEVCLTVNQVTVRVRS
jgi:hypothetical protein